MISCGVKDIECIHVVRVDYYILLPCCGLEELTQMFHLGRVKEK